MYRKRKRLRDEGVASSMQQSRAETVRDDGVASTIPRSRAEFCRVGEDTGVSSIRKSRGETSKAPIPARSVLRDDVDEVYPRQDIHGSGVNGKAYSAIIESIRSMLPEDENFQWNARDKTPARPSVGGGIFWKDKSDLDAFRERANEAHVPRYQETEAEHTNATALNKRLDRLEQLLISSQKASAVKQQEDNLKESLVRLLGLSSDTHQVRVGQGSFEEIRRPANISRILEELDSEVHPRYHPRQPRNLERETFAPPCNSFALENLCEVLSRGNVSDISNLAKNQAVHERIRGQVQSNFRAPSYANLEPEISSHPPRSVSVVDALEALLSGSITRNGRGGYGNEDISHAGSHFQANDRDPSQEELHREILSPAPIPLADEDTPEELRIGRKRTSHQQERIHEDFQVRAKHRSKSHGNSESQMSSVQPNSLLREDFLEEGLTGNMTKNTHAKVHKAQGIIYSPLQEASQAHGLVDLETRSPEAPLNSLPMDGSQFLRTDLPMQTLHPVQSHGDSDADISSSPKSPKSREKSPEILVTGYTTVNSKRGRIRKAKCQPVAGVQDANTSPMEDSLGMHRKSKRGRGCTRLDEVWNMPEGEHIICEFNEQCQPIKAEGRLLTRFVGTVVRKLGMCPLDVKDWRRVPEQAKQEMLKIVESKFLLPDDRKEDARAWIMLDLSDKWRNYRCGLRSKYYDESKPLSELVKLCPPNVDKDQWLGLLNLWNSPKWKRVSEANKKNREKNKIQHTSGTLSFAMVEEEMKEKNGVAPTVAQVYAKTHRHKDGTDVNEETATAIVECEKLGTTPDVEGDEGDNNWGDNTYRPLTYSILGLMPRKRKGPTLWRHGKSKRLQTIRIRREDYRNTLQQQRSMKEQLQAQDKRLNGLENKMSTLLSALQENLSQRELVNILRKASQAEVSNEPSGSEPEYRVPL